MFNTLKPMRFVFALLKNFLLFLYLLSILISIMFVFYIYTVFLPHLPTIKETYNAIPEQQKIFLTSHQDIFLCRKNSKSLSIPVAKSLVKQFLWTNKMKLAEWHIQFFLWNYLIKWSLSENEILILYFHYELLLNQNNNMEILARDLFNKELNTLTINETTVLFCTMKRIAGRKYPCSLCIEPIGNS
ncbi:hypothetical protein BegalDRAFT_1563 [Beggiatoa alba B18LD]|uniref:Uncharacterized protein n=2 Tax=Beggiatoa alba TaxID=1022 RepID=I3CFQ1_9GAMM|nr:hypothetical protein BegalDRAFT_1563 [Beggiatoa alba B18LD]